MSPTLGFGCSRFRKNTSDMQLIVPPHLIHRQTKCEAPIGMGIVRRSAIIIGCPGRRSGGLILAAVLGIAAGCSIHTAGTQKAMSLHAVLDGIFIGYPSTLQHSFPPAELQHGAQGCVLRLQLASDGRIGIEFCGAVPPSPTGPKRLSASIEGLQPAKRALAQRYRLVGEPKHYRGSLGDVPFDGYVARTVDGYQVSRGVLTGAGWGLFIEACGPAAYVRGQDLPSELRSCLGSIRLAKNGEEETLIGFEVNGVSVPHPISSAVVGTEGPNGGIRVQIYGRHLDWEISLGLGKGPALPQFSQREVESRAHDLAHRLVDRDHPRKLPAFKWRRISGQDYYMCGYRLAGETVTAGFKKIRTGYVEFVGQWSVSPQEEARRRTHQISQILSNLRPSGL